MAVSAGVIALCRKAFKSVLAPVPVLVPVPVVAPVVAPVIPVAAPIAPVPGIIAIAMHVAMGTRDALFMAMVKNALNLAPLMVATVS